jgi:murein L,D-transpeptidase YcbB/YkuD
LNSRAVFLIAASLAIASCGNSPSHYDPATDHAVREWKVNPDDVTVSGLQAAASDEQVKRFYDARGWKAAWTKDGVNALLESLDKAQAHALELRMFLPADAPADPAQVDAALTKAAIDYADALANGRVKPEKIREIYTLKPPKVDLAAGLSNAIAKDAIGEWLNRLAPQTPAYRALSQAYLQYRKQIGTGGAGISDKGEPIAVGDTDPRVPRLVEALQSNGYLPDDAKAPRDDGAQATPSALYTAEIANAVKVMQQDYGIKADGIVGPDTLEVLNTGPARRARQLAVNLERLRWLDRSPPGTRVDVNTAAAVLDYYRDGQHRDRRRVVVGQPGWETPQLRAPIYRLVANPNWVVPESIAESELADKGPGYFAKNNMVRRDGKIIQQPGPDSALGLVKFDMKDPYAIYLHDTPAKSLFELSQRQRSHGCVRVDNALQFARMLADEQGVREEFEKALASGDETSVDLPQDIPVRLMYHTAFWDGSRVRFRADAYGWDEDVAEALGLDASGRRVLQTGKAGDVGP